jgi:hypothetical protein
MGSITLTNIPQFIEQPGRTITKNIGQLDRMTVLFLGPYYAEVPFREDSPDTIYPLMFCTGWTERDNGGLKELTVNYAGRTDQDWPNEVLIHYDVSEKELSYSQLQAQTNVFLQPNPSNPGGSFTTTYSLGNFALHYVGEIITYKYVYYGTPIQKIASNAKVMSQYIKQTGRGSSLVTGFNADVSAQFPGPFGFSGPYQRLTHFTFTQVINKWYECQSSTEARYEVP